MTAERAYPKILRDDEQRLIDARRQQAGVQHPCTVGLALSGGGIRSAAFSLGVLQSLAKLHLLRHFDFLSTVSGGGYVGSFWGSLFVSSKERGGTSQERACDVDAVESRLGDSHSREIRWLRENGRYLSPNGSGDDLLAGAVLLRNWVAVNAVLAIFALAAFLGLDALRGIFLQPTEQTAWMDLIQHSLPAWVCLLAFVAWALPAGWAYWLISGKGGSSAALGAHALIRLGFCLGVAVMLFPSGRGGIIREIGAVFVALVGLTYLVWGLSGGPDPARERRARNRLSNWLKAGLIVSVVALGIVLFDLGGWLLLWAIDAFKRSSFAILGGGLVAVAAGAQRLGALLQSTKAGRIKIPLQIVAFAAASIVLGAGLIAISAGAHALAWRLPEFLSWTDGKVRLFLFVIASTAAWAAGRGFSFLNQSSQASFYSARLTRAFLGASNPARSSGEGQRVTEVIDGDDIPWPSYNPHIEGGPLHIINVTLNETIDGRSQIEQRDRKGMGLAVGPAGVSVGVEHHARWSSNQRLALEPVLAGAGGSRFRVFEAPPGGGSIAPERLDLGTWVALSGAAISTGLGSRTSLGLSILCGIFNLRLGRWWDSGVQPAWRAQAAGRTGVFNLLRRAATAAFPAQTFLLNEFLARFPGTARRHWYLTDGGHFENTGAYELIRRRVPMIVVVDSGEDRDYRFGDLADLVQKARTDFDAEVEFLDDSSIGRIAPEVREAFGTLEDLKGDRGTEKDGATLSLNRAHAALATIRHPDKSVSLLLVLKPSLTGREPLDVLQYATAHGDFPQQSTADQYFDERQWESYRKLGAHVADRVFRTSTDGLGSWSPRTLNPVGLITQSAQTTAS